MSSSVRLSRREVLHRLSVLGAAAAVPASLLELAACNSKPSCTDTSGLTPDELTQRVSTAQYTDTALDPAKKCQSCVQFVAGQPKACASCKIVKGPISPDGGCKLWVAKPA